MHHFSQNHLTENDACFKCYGFNWIYTTIWTTAIFEGQILFQFVYMRKCCTMSTKYQQHMFLLITFNFHFNEANGASHVALMVEIVHWFVIKTSLPASFRTAFVKGTYCHKKGISTIHYVRLTLSFCQRALLSINSTSIIYDHLQ